MQESHSEQSEQSSDTYQSISYETESEEPEPEQSEQESEASESEEPEQDPEQSEQEEPTEYDSSDELVDLASSMADLKPLDEEPEESEEQSEEQSEEESPVKNKVVLGKFKTAKYTVHRVSDGKKDLVGRYATLKQIAEELGLTYSKTYRIYRKQDKLHNKIMIDQIDF